MITKYGVASSYSNEVGVEFALENLGDNSILETLKWSKEIWKIKKGIPKLIS